MAGELHFVIRPEDPQPHVRAGASAGWTKVHSENFVSRVIACISAVNPAVSVKTASWLPASGLSVNTSYCR